MANRAEDINYEAVVVGSGPSGIAASIALINQGIKPLIIDVGILPEKDAFELQIKSRKNESMHLSRKVLIADNPAEKTWFLSSSPYRQDHRSSLIFEDFIVARPSFGLGGMSRVWGATFDIYDDFDGWPKDCIPSREDIDIVKSLVPHSTTTFSNLPDQGYINGHMASKKLFDSLIGLKEFDQRVSTLAINTVSNSLNSCKSCSECLTGCPYDSIWSSSDQLKILIRNNKVEYMPDSYVDRISETNSGVEISIIGSSNVVQSLITKRLFLAAGPISTAHILIKSNIVQKLTFKDTATIFTGIFAPFSRNTGEIKSHSLSQFWITTKTKNKFMAQIYPPSREHAERVISALPLKRILQLPVKLLISKVHPVIAYMNTDNSDELIIERNNEIISIRAESSIANKAEARRQLKKLSRPLLTRFSYLAVRLAKISSPGTGYHFGSSLAHGVLTDSFGRPSGLDRVHVVDASVLPNILPGSITPTMMANAARIIRSFYESFPQ